MQGSAGIGLFWRFAGKHCLNCGFLGKGKLHARGFRQFDRVDDVVLLSVYLQKEVYISLAFPAKQKSAGTVGPRPPPYLCPTALDPTEVLIKLVLCEAVMLDRGLPSRSQELQSITWCFTVRVTFHMERQMRRSYPPNYLQVITTGLTGKRSNAYGEIWGKCGDATGCGIPSLL